MGATATRELLERASAGDASAWASLVDRFGGVIWAATYGFRFDDATRADVVQLTWLRLLDHLDRIREPERLAGWLATVARNECLAVVRSTDRVRPTEDFTTLTSPDPPDELERDEEIRAVLQAMSEVDERCRQLIRLLTVDPPIPYEDIASAMDMPIGSIGPTRARCLDKIRRRPIIVRLHEGQERGTT